MYMKQRRNRKMIATLFYSYGKVIDICNYIALSIHPSWHGGFYSVFANPPRFVLKAPCRLLFFSFALAALPIPDKPFCRLPARLRDSGNRCISEESPPNILATAHPHSLIRNTDPYFFLSQTPVTHSLAQAGT